MTKIEHMACAIKPAVHTDMEITRATLHTVPALAITYIVLHGCRKPYVYVPDSESSGGCKSESVRGFNLFGHGCEHHATQAVPSDSAIWKPL